MNFYINCSEKSTIKEGSTLFFSVVPIYNIIIIIDIVK